ncbi:MAG: hypothetical protein QNJ15_03205 [Erythrobacter sp.]|nr:hypothetical protein [Erythrobacter sp.]
MTRIVSQSAMACFALLLTITTIGTIVTVPPAHALTTATILA